MRFVSTRRLVTRAVIAGVVSLLAATSAAQPGSTESIAAGNAVLLEQIARENTGLEVETRELAQVRKTQDDLDVRMQWIERRATVYALGNEFAQTLIEEQRQLPRIERFALDREQLKERLIVESNANLRVERSIRELDALDTVAAGAGTTTTGSVTAEPDRELAPALRIAVREQRDLLRRLSIVQEKRLAVLRDIEQSATDLDEHVRTARLELTRFLFWIPAPASIKTIGEFRPALAWMLAPPNWSAAGVAVREEFARRPLPLLVALIAAGILVAMRRRLRRALVALSPGGAVGGGRYGMRDVLLALAISLALVVPLPFVAWNVAAVLHAAPGAPPFVASLGDALVAVAKLVLALSGLAWLLDRDGVAVRHFGWDENALGDTADKLRRFAWVFVPIMFVAALNGLDHAPFGNRESVARLFFSVAMVTLAVFLGRLLRKSGPLMQRQRARAPRSLALSFHAIWFVALLVIPLAIAALAATGYFVAAAYFFGRLLDSVYLVFAAVMLYGLMALWVQVQRSKLSQSLDGQGAAAAPSREPTESGSEVAAARPAVVDIAAIGAQTRSLLDVFVTLLLIAGIWALWREGIPALSVVDNYALWTYTSTDAGKEIVHVLTVGHLALAIAVAVVTLVIVRNIGALLDIVLLQRIQIQPDATYAVKVIARYVVAFIGLMLACNILGIRWGDVQWLVAALGVGLGFGLQEIVANFVSGVIMIAERPIRIGDVITVGSVSGTVSRIHARATVLVDFDHKEVIIPNKAFITERVVNWTLSNQTTRLLIPIGVACGSDIALVQRLILGSVRGNPDVLHNPAPSVYLMAIGDSALNFEIRAFVDSLDKRLRVQHEIYVAVERVLRENGIELPFPQRDLHIRSAPGLANAFAGPIAPAATASKP